MNWRRIICFFKRKHDFPRHDYWNEGVLRCNRCGYLLRLRP